VTSGSPTPTTATSGLEDAGTSAGSSGSTEARTDELRAIAREVRVFEMGPDDVVLVGNVHGGLRSIEAFTRWAQREWPDRKVVCFGDDIDVQKLSDADLVAAGFRRVPEDAREGQRPKLLSGSPEGSPAWHAHAPAHFLDYAECDWDVCADYREEMAAQRVLRGGSETGGGDQP
jgi:hypothetical protein